MLDWNSATHIAFFDPTSSAASSGFDESTAPSGNLASAMRNWVIIVETKVQAPPSRAQSPSLPDPTDDSWRQGTPPEAVLPRQPGCF